jgi:hypothetical protein
MCGLHHYVANLTTRLRPGGGDIAETIFFDDQGLEFLFHREDGEIMRDFRRRAENVVQEAKRNAEGRSVAGANNPEGRGPRIDTGDLHNSIRYDVLDTMGEVALGDGARARPIEIVVFTDIPYAYWLETGLRNGATYPFLTPALDAAGE